MSSHGGDAAKYENQRASLLTHVNNNAKAIIGGEFDKVKKPYKPKCPPVRPEAPEWKKLLDLQEKIVRWKDAQALGKTPDASAEIRYNTIMECRREFPKIARSWDEPDLPKSMKPHEPKPEEPAKPEAPTLAWRPNVPPPNHASAFQAPPIIQAPTKQGQSSQAQSTLFTAIPTPQNNPTRAHRPGPIILDDDEEDGIKRERDDDYDPTLSSPPPSDAGPTPGPTPGAKDVSKPKRKRQRIEDFAMLVRSEDPADLRYLRKRIVNKHEAQLMQIDHQLEKLGASVEGGMEGGGA